LATATATGTPYELGTPTTQFASAAKRGRLFILGIVLLIGGETTLFWAAFSPYFDKFATDRPAILAGGAVVAICGLLCLEYYLRYRQVHVKLFADGFSRERDGKTETVRWDDIAAVWQSVTKRYTNGIYTGTTHVYTLKTGDGRTFIFNDQLKKVEKLGQTAINEVSNRKFPGAVALYNNGATVQFGPVAISKVGLTKGDQTLSWPEIEAVNLNKGYLNVKKRGKWLKFANVPVSSIPNVFVLVAMIDRIVGVNNSQKK